MEIKLKLGEVININQTLKEIVDGETKIDPLFKFRLLGIMKAMEVHIANFDVIRNDKIKEYGTTGEDGNISISTEDKEAMSKFFTDINEIVTTDVTIVMDKLKVADVMNHISGSDNLLRLYPIMEE